MVTNLERRLSRLEESYGSEPPSVHWVKGQTQAKINFQVESLIASGQAKHTDLFVHWQAWEKPPPCRGKPTGAVRKSADGWREASVLLSH
jgi:hypothetical protein